MVASGATVLQIRHIIRSETSPSMLAHDHDGPR